MRNPLTVTVTLLLIIGSADIPARESLIEPHAMFYYHMPFDGGKAADRQTSFGFRMDNVAISRDHSIEYAGLMQRPAIMDLKMNSRGIESFHVSGMDYLDIYRIHRANGDEDEAAETTETAESAGEEGAEEESPAGPTVADDISNTVSLIAEKASAGILIGVGLGIGLLAGVGD